MIPFYYIFGIAIGVIGLIIDLIMITSNITKEIPQLFNILVLVGLVCSVIIIGNSMGFIIEFKKDSDVEQVEK